MEPNQNTSLFQLNLDAANSYTLRSAASWAKVLAVVGFIMAAVFVILGIMMQSMINRVTGRGLYDEGFGRGSMQMAGTMGLIIYVIGALLYAVSSMFALNFSNKITTALKTNDQAALNAGFAGVRNYFAFWTVLMIICLLFMLIGLAGIASVPR